MPDWVSEFNAAVTVCDDQGVILFMNQRACKTFAARGGETLVGKSLYDCHPEPAQKKLRELLQTRKANSYTIEKNGVKKLIHQSPWYRDGKFGGIVELSMEIPFDMPHFVRKEGN